MQRGRRDLAAVELVEDGSRDPDAEPRTEPVHWRELVHRVPVWARWAAAGLALTAAVLVLVAQQRADAAHEQRVARITPLGPDLDAPLTAVWQADVGTVVGRHEDLLLTSDARDATLVALDTGDGSVRWRRDDVDAMGCELEDASVDTLNDATDPRVADDSRPDLLTCRLWDQDARDTGSTTIVVLDAASGELVRTLDIGTDVSTTWRTGTAVIVIRADAEGRVTVDRWSLLTGERSWSYRSPTLRPEDQRADPGTSYSWSSERVEIHIGDRVVRLDPATGREIPEETEPDAAADHVLRFTLADDAVVTATLTDSGARTEVRDADGTTRWTRDGLALRASVDDGTAAGIVLMSDRRSGTSAVDARTGDTVWRSDDVVGLAVGEPMVLSSLVLTQASTGRSEDADGGLVALDAETGRVAWRAGEGTVSSWQTYTDGDRLLTLDQTRDTVELVAREVTTGTVAWRTAAPPAAEYVDLLPDRTLLVGGGSEITAFRPPAR